MRDGAELRIATDDGGYLVWILERLQRSDAFLWTARTTVRLALPPFRLARHAL